jgi:hypothetical protein
VKAYSSNPRAPEDPYQEAEDGRSLEPNPGHRRTPKASLAGHLTEAGRCDWWREACKHGSYMCLVLSLILFVLSPVKQAAAVLFLCLLLTLASWVWPAVLF